MGCTQSTASPNNTEHKPAKALKRAITPPSRGSNSDKKPPQGRPASLSISKSDPDFVKAKDMLKRNRLSLENRNNKSPNTVSLTAVRTPDSVEYQEFEKSIEATIQEEQDMLDLPITLQRNPREGGRRKSLQLPYTPDLSQENSEQFDYLCVIGKGAFGRVVRVRGKHSKKLFAMKIVYKPFLKRLVPEIRRQVEVERQMLNLFDHPFIVRLIYEFETDDYVFLVMNLLRGGTLYKHMKAMNKVPESLVQIWSAEIILALEHMHKNRVVYRDLKPDNIMLDENGHAHVIDLGLAVKLAPGEKLAVRIGAPGYKAPEMLKGPHDFSIDYWNLGVLMYKMLTGKHPMERRFSDAGLDDNTKRGASVRLPRALTSNCKDLLSNLLIHDPAERIGCRNGPEELRAHPFFKDIDWELLQKKATPIPDIDLITIKHIDDKQEPLYGSARELMDEFQRQEQQKRANAGKPAQRMM